MSRSLQRWLPPAILDMAGNALNRRLKFRGPYTNWAQASAASSGYSDEQILTKAKQAMLKVKNGEAVGERDTVLFDHKPHSFPMLSCLLRAALTLDNRLRVLDFGGSLGSTYFQCRDFLQDLHELKWFVIDQPNFVACGQETFSDEKLSFYFDIDTCISEEQPNIVLLSSVVQYLENPYNLLDHLNHSGIPYILFDRTPCAPDGKEVLGVQIVPPKIYPASYPAWIFNQQNLLSSLSNYDLLLDFDANDGCISSGGLSACYRGFFLRS